MTRTNLVKYAILFIGLVVALAVLRNRFADRQTVGWIPKNLPPVPFQPGLIAEGNPLPEFRIELIDLQPGRGGRVKPAEICKFEVRIKPAQGNLDGFPIPTMVFLVVDGATTQVQGEITIHSTTQQSLVEPHAIEDGTLVYRGQIAAPRKFGNHAVLARARYNIVQDRSDRRAATPPYQQDSAGISIHVQ